MNSFSGKKYLIFAGASTIGTDLIEKLTNLGASVIFTSRSVEKAEIVSQKYHCDYIICNDISNFDEVDSIFKQVKEKFEEIDGVVNFAGSILIKAAHQTSLNEYNDTIMKNLTSAFAVTRSSGKHTSNASVVLISSVASSVGISNHEAISAAKAGIEGLVKSAACTYSAKNIRFNAVAPSLIETNLSQMITQNEMSLKASIKMHALGRIGNANDISQACLFLLNPQNNWITGQVIKVEGGFSLKAKVQA